VLLIFSVAWYHGFRALILGQFAIIEALLIVGAIFAIQKEQDVIAGVLLALSISKPQMSFLLILFVLIWAITKRRWSLIISMMVSFGIIIGLSLFVMPDWPLRWIRQVVSYPDYTNTKPVVGIIADLFPAFSQWINIGLTLLVILYLIWEWILALGKDDSWFQWTAAMTLLLTNIIVVRTATTNYLSMVPGLILVFSIWVSRWNRRGRLAVLGVLALFFVVLWILFLSTVDGNLESPVMYLPFPIVLLFFLWWIRWWATRPTKLPLEKDYVIGVNP
ncbi:MAG: DUF2029 domain-containing protein, partial [Anaerolineales bacterium]|nr:DUF2029 domain-containing protein [Anaerolineales bacterium]